MMLREYVRCLLGVLFAIASVDAQSLDFDRRTKTVPFRPLFDDLPLGWVELSEDLYRCTFRLPAHIFERSNDDPFGDRVRTPQEMLEAVGIPFEGDAKAAYDKETLTLTVDQTRKRMEMVRAFIGTDDWNALIQRGSVRVEVYEVSVEDGLQALESAQSEGEHTPERDAVIAAMQGGKAKLVTSPSAILRSGSQGKVIDGSASQYPVEIELLPESDEVGRVLMEERVVGTTLTASIQIGPYGRIIDLDIALEHHTAPPSVRTTVAGHDVVEFHSKSILTNVQLESGNWMLIGNWRPSEDDGKLLHLVFVTANVIPVGDYGQKQR